MSESKGSLHTAFSLFPTQPHSVSQIYGSCDVWSSFHLFPACSQSHGELVTCAHACGLFPLQGRLLQLYRHSRELLSPGFLNNTGANRLPRQSKRGSAQSPSSCLASKQPRPHAPCAAAGDARTTTACPSSAQNTTPRHAFITVNHSLGFEAHPSELEKWGAR